MRTFRNFLLVNPWIYDFAAYDFWIKPLGLLYLGACLRQWGYDVQLLDCLDRFHPAMRSVHPTPFQERRADGTGKFYRQEIEKPSVLKHIPRTFCRYGMPPKVVSEQLSILPEEPDVILVTSFMTYWYPAVRDIVILLREHFPHAVIMLGGIYATLCPEHAQHTVQPDCLFIGQGEGQFLQFLNRQSGIMENRSYKTLDDLPLPLYDLYPHLESVALLTSRGCPMKCSFCASRILNDGYQRRSIVSLLQEVQLWYETFRVQHFAFYDDALLYTAQAHLMPFLESIIHHGWNIQFYTPNGLSPKAVNEESAAIMANAGVNGIALSFETIHSARQKAMSFKVTKADLQRSVDILEKNGYDRKEIGVYILMGLPHQDIDEVKQTIEFVHGVGAKIQLSSLSPIPGTVEYQRALQSGLWSEDFDLLLTNTTIHPILSKTVGYERADELMKWSKSLNAQL